MDRVGARRATSPTTICRTPRRGWPGPATASFNPTTGLWSPVALLTQNAALHALPRLSRGPNGDIVAVWHENVAGLLSGTPASPDRLVTAVYDHGWQAPRTAVANIPGLADFTAGDGNGAATIAYTEVITPTGALTPTAQVFTSAWNGSSWTAPAQLTSAAVNQARPQVVYNSANQPLLIWLNGSQLQLENLSAGAMASLALPTTVGNLDDFRVVQDASGNLAAVFSAQSPQRDLYVAFFDQAHNLWGNPTPLTNDTASESYPSPGLDQSGRLLLAYASTAENLVTKTALSGAGQVVTYTVPVAGATDLVTLAHAFTQNLTLGNADLSVSNDHPAPGGSVVITATVHNTGDLALGNVTVGFYDGDPSSGGTLIGTSSLAAPLAAGSSAALTAAYPVPATGGMHTLYAVADPSNAIAESNEADNTGHINAFGPYLAILGTRVSYWGGSSIGLQSQITNVGTTSAPPSTIAYYQGSITGTLLITDTVPALPVGQTITVTTPLNFGTLPTGTQPLVAAVNQSDFPEALTANNLYTTTLSVGPDLMVSPYYIWTSPLLAPSVTITATLYNVGSATATNATVGFYRRGTLDPGSLLTTQTVPSLASGSATQVSATVPGPLGCGLYVIADPNHALPDVNRANNLASLTVTGGRCANFQNTPISGAGTPLSVAFADLSTGANTSWLWDFGDGATSTQQFADHPYTSPGAYTVTLTVSGSDGSDQIARPNAITIAPSGVTTSHAGFVGSPASGTAPLTVSFADQSSGSITGWSWDFGDGSSSTQENPTHTYAQPGTYTVALTVAGPGGANTTTQAGAITVNPVATSTATLTVQPGWNLIALPVQPATQVTLEGLARLTTASGLTPVAVVEWAQGQFQVHLAGQADTYASDSVALNAGYFLRTANGGSLAVTGQPITTSQAIPLQAGWNLIAVPHSARGSDTLETLAEAAQHDTGQPVVAIVEWSQGQFEVHLTGQTDTAASNPVTLGSGYFLRISGSASWTP